MSLARPWCGAPVQHLRQTMAASVCRWWGFDRRVEGWDWIGCLARGAGSGLSLALCPCQANLEDKAYLPTEHPYLRLQRASGDVLMCCIARCKPPQQQPVAPAVQAPVAPLALCSRWRWRLPARLGDLTAFPPHPHMHSTANARPLLLNRHLSARARSSPLVEPRLIRGLVQRGTLRILLLLSILYLDARPSGITDARHTAVASALRDRHLRSASERAPPERRPIEACLFAGPH